MRVLHVLNDLRHSGVEKMLRCAAVEFGQCGIKADILTTVDRPGDLAPELAKAGYHIYHIPFRRSGRFAWIGRRRMRAGRYDVIHLHAERAQVWFGLLALLTGARVVRTVHNVLGFEGRLRWVRGWQRRVLSRLGVVYVAISHSAQENEQQRFGIQTILVPNWYDSGHFFPPSESDRKVARESLCLSPNDVVFITVGNCNPAKNHPELIRALAGLPLGRRPVWLHVGEEDSVCSERRLAESLGVTERVRFCGPQPDVLPYLHASDLYVMPSLYEGFGVAIAEALSVGLPAILSDVPGLRDWSGQVPGVIFAEPHAAALREALEDFLERGPPFWRQRAACYPALAQTTYSAASALASYVALYKGERLTARP